MIRGLLSCLVLLTASAGAGAEDPLAPLLARLDAIRKSEGIAGLALVITDRESVRYCGGLGAEDWDSDRPMGCQSMIRIGSVSKAFTGLTFLALESDGLLDLDQRVTGVVDPPPFQNPWSSTHPVTVAQLLEHTAGLMDLSKREFDHNQPLALGDALKVDPESRRLHWPPGLHSSYSNAGAGIAAFVMEQATGRDFEDYAAGRVFQPLGMTTASFSLTSEIQQRLATGYDSDGRTAIPYWHTLYRPFGGINVEVSQMAPFLRMLLGRGRLDGRAIFSGDQIQRMENPQTTLAARAGLTFGYGLGNYHATHRGFVFHGHGGDADGYLCHFGYNRELDRGYFLLINAFRNASLRRLKAEVLDFLVGARKADYRPGQPQPESALIKLSGRYRSATRRFAGQAPSTLEVRYTQGRLVLVRGDRRQHLIPLGNGLFRRGFEPVATTAFVEEDGTLFLHGPFGNYQRIEAEPTAGDLERN